jgi:AcrR family transcriptional regulator
LRADAQQNRSAVLCAAPAVFARMGPEAPLEEVARAAGVGIATLYRRFPTREALIEAVFEAKMAAYADRAEAAAVDALAHPWPAFRDHVSGLVEGQVNDPAFGSVLLRPMQGSCLFARDHERAVAATKLLVRRTKQARVVRRDLHHSDLYLLLVATAAVVAEPGPLEARKAARRLCALFLNSVRSVPPTTPAPPPTTSTDHHHRPQAPTQGLSR